MNPQRLRNRCWDGGKLVLDTYTEVFSTDDAEYEKAQLQKIV